MRRYGYGYRGLGYGRRASQERRFAALAAVGALDGARLLDAGCGFGDLLAWLHARGVRPRYTGLDLCAPMIERCRERFAGIEAVFVTGDVLDYEPDEPYDYVVASGIFGYAAKGMRARVQPTLKRLYAMSATALAVNFLSARAASRAPGRLYLHAPDLLEFALTLTPAVRMDHTYMPNDFTLFMYRVPFWQGGE
ncbi:MAG TPA: class I SAM-dependent methyltransferase [Burkholderiales bacterium]|nr:class I SAM-dependent methyltransferase [Burkholderiales bacterium]